MKKPMLRCAFTLVELLTVVIIIAILASLIATAVHSAKRRADGTVCKSNLKQMGVLLNDFVGEKNEYPLAFNPEKESKYPEHASTWSRSLKRIGGLSDIFREGDLFDCPSARRPGDLGPNEGYTDYGYDSDGIVGGAEDRPLGLGGKGGEQGSGYAPPVKASEVVSPVEMIAIGDSFFGWRTFIVDGRYDSIGLRFTLTAREGETTRALRRHSKYGNYLFCDGHVESVGLGKLYFIPASNYARLWNRDNEPHLERLVIGR